MNHTPADPAPTHWAILIGVGMSIDSRAELGDEKQAWRRDQSLEGAVADIHMMERYLKDDPRVKISKLTATKPTHGTEKNTPLEPPEDQPTRKNVESLLKTIIKEGLSRNIHHVYIHFSGHGTDSSDGTFALSLFDPGPLGRVRFLTDHLATALQRITRQGIRVTVVLDCCFSGSMKRSSDVSASHVRFIEHDPSEDLMETENPFLEADTEGSRQAYLNLPHLLDPKGYVVITACGPRENAREVKLENGKRHGALSYFLHDSLMLLRRSEDQVSFETLYNRLQAKFHVNLPQQTPRHYGNMRESFFQNLSCESSRYLVTTVKVPDQEEFILKAGEAHGVHKGDQYEAYPYYASEVNSKALRKESVLLVVKEVENLQSKVMPVDHDQLERFKEVMTWKAQLITSKSDRKTLIYASKSLGVAEKDRLRKYLSNHPYVKLLEEDGDLGVSTFNISINNDESYEIREGDSRRAPNTPLFPRNEEDSLNLLSDALGHLATYKFFEGIENSHPDKCFGKSLDIETHSTPGPDQWFEVQDKAKFEFSIINKDKGTLFFAIFNLRSSWEVCNIMREAGEGSFFEIPIQDGGFRFPLPMKIPEAVRNKGGTQNEDIIKIFITNQVPYFPFSVLPKLGAGGDRQHVARNEMTKFLESLERGNGDTRQSTTGQWITRNFSIRTHV